MSAHIEPLSDQHLQVIGELDFDNALALKKAGEALIDRAGDALEMDFSRVTRSGSAGLTLLCSWLRHAEQLDKRIFFTHLPADLMGVAKVSGVDQILPVK
ncbi:MAG: STAS domain-containing protein [Pseudomonadales bacterium]|jgi:phospholipid transport system transporter-binding protein